MASDLEAQEVVDRATASRSNRPTVDLEQQCLRVLRCTAQALANGPGGLRFKAGTRPWLEGASQRQSHIGKPIAVGARP